MASKTRILFVDDDAEILALLKRKLSSMHYEWDMHFTEGAQQALTLFQRGPFDVVVADLLMPGIGGISFLDAVMKKYSNTIRIVLSGASDKEMRLRSANVSHQFIEKPFDPAELKSVILRAVALRDLLSNKMLQGLVANISSLPRLSSLYIELVREIQSPDSKLSTIGTIISKDIGMTGKILQLVNSAYLGLRTRVSNIQYAVQLLGLEAIKALVLTYDVFSRSENMDLENFSLRELMEHSQKVGLFARLITKNENPEESLVNDAFISGMLHDVGKIVLAKNFPKQYGEIQVRAKFVGDPAWQHEQETFGATHAEVGAYLLGLWRLPNPVIEAVAFHHQPTNCSHKMFSPLTAVHVADVLDQKRPRACRGKEPSVRKFKVNQIDVGYLRTLSLTEKLDTWRELCSKAERDQEKRISEMK